MTALPKLPPVGLSRDQTSIFEQPYSSAGQRFWSKVKADGSGCWLWQGAIFGGGYGSFWLSGKNIRAHQFSFDQAGRSVPAGYVLDHMCRRKACVRPDHLRAVTQRENSMDAGVSAINARKTRCPRGHEYSGVNVQGRRICHPCAAEWMRKHRRSRAR